MTKREPLMNEMFFEKHLNFIEDTIIEKKLMIDNPEPNFKMNLVYLLLKKYLERKFECIYSMGYPIASLLPLYQECIDALALYKSHPKAKNVFFNGYVDEYINALELVSWGILLNVPQPLFEKTVELIDSEGQTDALLDRLIQIRLPRRRSSQQLAFSKFYGGFYQALLREPVAPVAVGQYLTVWYDTCLKQTATYDIHKQGDESSFAGYWCWEAAALSYGLGIDDGSYQDFRYYPKDMVVYARQQTPTPPTPPGDPDLPAGFGLR